MKMNKALIYLTIYVTLLSVGLLWRIEKAKDDMASLQHGISNQIAISDDCVDEDDFYNDETDL